MSSENEQGIKSRERIIELFPIKKRETELMKIISALITDFSLKSI